MRCEDDLIEVLLVQESGEEVCGIGVVAQLRGVCAVAVPIVGICWRLELSYMQTPNVIVAVIPTCALEMVR